jgi:hypothetical protein
VQCSPISMTAPIFGMPIRHSGAHFHSSAKVRHVKACSSLDLMIKSIGYQRLRGPGTPRQHPFPMQTDLLVRCNSAGQDQCG